jgi:hypothetical protein
VFQSRLTVHMPAQSQHAVQLTRANLSHLLHDARLSLGEGNVPATLVYDKLDFNLSPLFAILSIVAIVIFCLLRSLS